MFLPGNNCWQVAKAKRVRFLVGGADYFAAFRESVKQAQHSVLITGWDVDSRTSLLRGPVQDDLPVTLGAFLDAMVRARPTLQVKLLTWDFAALYWAEREWFPRYKLQWNTHERLQFSLDNTHALGGSHHQKIVVVDDAVAFVGGLDLTKRRWDTPAHHADDARRTDTEGERYPPFHDMQMMVDGEAAIALGDLLRSRWQQATGEWLEKPATDDIDRWPTAFKPQMHNAEVAIARTLPKQADQPAVREVEQLYLDMIATARQTIYIENQYLTSRVIGNALCQRLRAKNGPEIIMVLPQQTSGWLEQVTMDVLRSRLLQQLHAADAHKRLRIYYPIVPGLGDDCINVHAKLMIVDDRILRIGSANLSNRSMGLDTECDLAIAGRTKAQCKAIKDFRNYLLSQHLGVTQQQMSRVITQRRSLIAAVESLIGKARTLRELNGDVPVILDTTVPEAATIDPEQPLSATILSGYLMSNAQQLESEALLVIPLRKWVNEIALLSFGLALRWTPLERWLDAGLDIMQKPLNASLNILDSLEGQQKGG